ncbi:PREDICTED: putative inhibitor of apoptosis [Amphimedon queenslandica]|uniref:RING-type domain-containing protein n=1 Tax=Amphimedon queenslandica TaxID=400682 RepID=A0A1X7U0M0_AMPQE|nr:PREDICTED: putative inhibitor of apoptosis [Amphimedon queenslandica]|eukprot:XP_011406381.1 PREDICTED: putative inhibitor of apoptosis [Amphimedon queenslandica]
MDTMLQPKGSFDAGQFSRNDFFEYLETFDTVATDGFEDEYHRDGRGRDGKVANPYSSKRDQLVGVQQPRYTGQGHHGYGRRDEMVTPTSGIIPHYYDKPKKQAYQRSVSENRASRSKERSHSKERKRSVSPQITRKSITEPTTTSEVHVVQKRKDLKKHNKREHRFDYQSFDVRVESFYLKPSWAKDERLIAALASHGFCFTGHEDIVECHVCRVRIESWSIHDDILWRHLESEPNCQFIREQYQFSIEELCSIKFAAYKSLKNRESSFKYWPIPRVIGVLELVEAGWYYTGKDDITQCFTCGCRNEEWKKGDDPFTVHGKLSKNCSFLMEAMKHKSSSKLVIDFSKEESRRQSFKHYPKTSKVPIDDLVKSGFHLLSLDPAVKVKCYSCDLVADIEWMDGKGPAGIHIKMSPDCPVAQENEDTASLPAPIMTRRQLQNKYLYKSRGDSKEKVQESLPALILCKSSNPHTPPTPYSLPNMHHTPSPTLTHELTRSQSLPEEEDKLCVVCLDNTKQYAIVPCGHLCVCHDCSQHLLLCPICRIKKEDILRIYNS